MRAIALALSVATAACPSTDDGRADTVAAGDADAVATGDTHAIATSWWAPALGSAWQIQLSGTVDTSVDAPIYDVDMIETTDAQLAALKGRGVKVVCYFSAGSHEDWRADADRFPAAAIGKPLVGWPGERWLDVRDARVRSVLAARMDVAVTRGCDAVDPDNVDVFANDSGFDLTRADGIDFVRWLASEAHARGLGVGLKNGLDIVPEVVADMDFEVNEECLDFDECDALAPFIAAAKPVFHIEYVERRDDGPGRLATVCAAPSRAGFSTLVKTLDLDAWGLACPR